MKKDAPQKSDVALTAPRIRQNIPMADYLATPALGSGTALRTINQSPFHAKYHQENERDNSKVADIGIVAHRMLLENSEDGIKWIEADDWRTKAAKEIRDQAYSDGQIPLLFKQQRNIRAMVDAARHFINCSEVREMLTDGNPEVTVEWDDNGVLCKARPDYLSDNFHVSVKTVNGITSPAAWIRYQLSSCGYDFGLQFYERGLIANGVDVGHRILVIDQVAPYGCFLVGLDPAKKAICDSNVDRAIRTWGECVTSGIFPGFETRTMFAEPTPWELAEAEEREMETLR